MDRHLHLPPCVVRFFSSRDWDERSEPDSERSAGALVRWHVSKPLPCLPISASLYDLVFRSSDEVPPHENRFGKWRPSYEQQPASGATGDAHFRTRAPHVVQDPLLEWLVIEPGVAVQDQQRVFEGRLNRQSQGLPSKHLHVRTEDFREVNCW